MSHRPNRILTVALLSWASFGAGCNILTGADGLTLGDGSAEEGGGDVGPGPGSGVGAGDQSSGAGNNGAGVGGSGNSGSGNNGAGNNGAGGNGGTGNNGGAGNNGGNGGSGNGGSGGAPPPPPPPVGDAADGVSITDLELYQGVRVPLMNAQSDIPIVAGRDAMVRVFYQTDADYDGQPVTARFTSGQYYEESTATLSGSSSAGSLSSTLNIHVPGHMIAVGGTYRVDLVQPNGSGTNSAAGYPPGTMETPLGAQSSGDVLRVVLVPVQYNGELPDTSPAQVDKYAQRIAWQYPIPQVEVTVRSQAISFSGYLGNYNGWSQLLDQVTQVRTNDNVANDVYYYGIHNANGNGLLGLGWIGSANSAWTHTAIGVGWTGDTAPETAVHELGHNHGREHSPCGVSGDAAYPHSGASIGVMAYNPGTDTLLSPSNHVDFMSYCDPAWVSDWTFKALFNRLRTVNNATSSMQASAYVHPDLVNRYWERVRIIDGATEWLPPVQLRDPPSGQEVPVVVRSLAGAAATVGHYHRYDHIDGGVVFIRQPDNLDASNAYHSLEIAVASLTYALVR